MSCAAVTQIPAPPTSQGSCAVPIGGSNSSILDTCCNGHINVIATYSAPGSDSNARSDDGCFQFCVTDNPDYVSGCLTNTLGEYEKSPLMFECFNVGSVKKDAGSEESGYGNAGARVYGGKMGWAMKVVVGLGFVGWVTNTF